MGTARKLWLVMGVLALAPTAHAATPVTVVTEAGAGDADIAVDASGNGHLVWSSKQTTGGATQERLRYCVIPASNSSPACDPATLRTLYPPTEGTSVLVDAPDVFVTRAGTVIVVAGISQPDSPGTRAFQSPSFSPTIIGPDLHEAALGPHGRISLLSGNTKEYFLAPLTGASAASPTVTLPGQPAGLITSEGNRVAEFGTRAVVVRDGNTSSEYVISDGSESAAGWTGPFALPRGRNSIVASGPSGLVLVSEREVDELDDAGRPTGAKTDQYVASVFDGTAFVGSVGVSTQKDPIFPDLYADQASGVFHFVFEDAQRDLRWRGSSDGKTWSESFAIVRNADKPETDPAAVAGNARGGLVTWDGTGLIKVARIQAIPGTGDGSGEGGDGTGGDGTGPGGTACRPPACTAAPGGNPSEVVGNQRHTVDVVVSGCGTKRVRALLALERETIERRAGRRIVTRVQRVVFRLARQKHIVKRPPYKRFFFLRNAAAGRTYTLRATVKLRVREGAQPAKTRILRLSKRFFVCRA